MASTLTNLIETITLSGLGTYVGAAGLGQSGGAINMGTGTWGAMTTAFTFGTSNNQVNQCYIAQRTVATVSNDNLDFGAGSLKSPVGDTATFSKIKAIFINIETPDGTKSLQVGPGVNATPVVNAFQGPYGAVTANVWVKVFNYAVIALEPIAGFSVTGTTGVLGIYNATAGNVIYDIIVLGLA